MVRARMVSSPDPLPGIQHIDAIIGQDEPARRALGVGIDGDGTFPGREHGGEIAARCRREQMIADRFAGQDLARGELARGVSHAAGRGGAFDGGGRHGCDGPVLPAQRPE